MQKNIHLKKYKTGIKLTVKESANLIRTEMAIALRKSPFFANVLIAGFDEEGPHLYWIDYLAAMIKVSKGAQGYAGYFLGGLLEARWKPDLTYEEGIKIIKECINELDKRFLVS